MIRLFRKIRNQLLSENKYSIYFLYATGEIILVMIGILLALQIDNWNENRIEKQEVRLRLASLKEALYEDNDYLNKAKSIDQFRANSLQHLLKLAGDSPINFDISGVGTVPFEENWIWDETIPEDFNRDFVEIAFSWSGRYIPMITNYKVINELESTGIYSEIENKELKQAINHYYREVDWRMSHDEFKFTVEKWDELLIRKGVVWLDISNIDDPLDIIEDDPEATAILKRIILEAHFRATSAEKLMTSIESIIHMINSEISN